MNINELKNTIGINEVGALAKLLFNPYNEVWAEAKKRGVRSIEICALIETNARARAFMEEQAKQFKWGFPKCFITMETIYDFISEIKDAGLEVYSCHLMGAEMYAEYILECLPFIKEIHNKTGISNFVMSGSFTSVETVKSFIPCMEEAAAELARDGITLCCHNHHMDSELLENGKSAIEMIIEHCPHMMLQYDTGWAWYGYQDPVEFIKAHGDRIASLHLKDLTEDGRERTDDGRFTAIGYGAVPTAKCLAVIDCCDLKPGMLIIDQDASAGDVYDDMEKGIQFVAQNLK